MAEDFPTIITDEARSRAPISSETVIGVSVLFLSLATIFTGTRLYTRFTVYQQFWWDDWSMLVAWMGTIVLCTLLTADTAVHHADTPVAEYKQYVELFQDLQMVARTSMFFAKLSILLLYIRLFFPKGVTRSALWWIIQIVVWLNFLYTVGLILAIALQCVPYNKPYGSSCVNQYMVLISASIINIISDLLVLLIPMASVWRLNMSRRRKWAVWALFAFGIARLAYQVPMADGTDTTVIYMIVVILALAEQVIGIVAGCAPIVSTWFVRLVLRKGSRDAKISPAAAANAPRTLTQRFKLDREGGEPETPQERRLRKWKRSKASDPYPTLNTTILTTASEEALDPGFEALRNAESGRRSDALELSDVTSVGGRDRY
ncbi:hypothetical protein J7T55_011030 [Diaporthe amygdali]|uniref:uncharacterized protein n=1 Tax=Phomopsis amygdali TaxID=1214568 RepID=UPI0022FE3CF5|nr:uncharacterized protein J7T55_011030 [Diaporthe amygdali]KAJ0106935.1 hypothetical protein J7T55_011030 [Diaporthe amygdali]